MYTLALKAMAKLAIEHERKAAELERAHINRNHEWDSPEAERAHREHVQTSQQLDMIACRNDESCAYYSAVKYTRVTTAA